MSDNEAPEPAGSIDPNQPLTNTFDWAKRAVLSGVIVVGITALLIYQGSAEWWQITLVLLVVLGGYSAWSWLRAQHWIQPVAGHLRIGRLGAVTEIAGDDVVAVKYIMNKASPDFILVTSNKRRHVVRTSRLEKGHSTLFRWLAKYAPQAQLDRRSEHIRDLLELRGLLP